MSIEKRKVPRVSSKTPSNGGATRKVGTQSAYPERLKPTFETHFMEDSGRRRNINKHRGYLEYPEDHGIPMCSNRVSRVFVRRAAHIVSE